MIWSTLVKLQESVIARPPIHPNVSHLETDAGLPFPCPSLHLRFPWRDEPSTLRPSPRANISADRQWSSPVLAGWSLAAQSAAFPENPGLVTLQGSVSPAACGPRATFQNLLTSSPGCTEKRASGESLTWLRIKSVLEARRISDTKGASLNPPPLGRVDTVPAAQEGRNFRGGGRCQGVAAVVSLFQQKEPPPSERDRPTESEREGGLAGGGGGRRREGGRDKRAPGGGGAGKAGEAQLARTPPLFVHSALGSGRLAGSPPSRFIVLQVASPAAQTRRAARLRSPERVTWSPGLPRPTPAAQPQPGPTRSGGWDPPLPKLAHLCARAQARAGETALRAPTLPRPLQEFVWGSAAGRRHLPEFTARGGVAAALRCYLAHVPPLLHRLPSRGQVPEKGSWSARWPPLGSWSGSASGSPSSAKVRNLPPPHLPHPTRATTTGCRTQGNAMPGAGGAPLDVPGVAGCAEEAARPGFSLKVPLKVRASAWGWAGKRVRYGGRWDWGKKGGRREWTAPLGTTDSHWARWSPPWAVPAKDSAVRSPLGTRVGSPGVGLGSSSWKGSGWRDAGLSAPGGAELWHEAGLSLLQPKPHTGSLGGEWDGELSHKSVLLSSSSPSSEAASASENPRGSHLSSNPRGLRLCSALPSVQASLLEMENHAVRDDPPVPPKSGKVVRAGLPVLSMICVK